MNQSVSSGEKTTLATHTNTGHTLIPNQSHVIQLGYIHQSILIILFTLYTSLCEWVMGISNHMQHEKKKPKKRALRHANEELICLGHDAAMQTGQVLLRQIARSLFASQQEQLHHESSCITSQFISLVQYKDMKYFISCSQFDILEKYFWKRYDTAFITCDHGQIS